jgi:hypothetical protein
MALSDVCADFLEEIKDAKSEADRREAVRNLHGAAAYYSVPPFRYAGEIETIQEACSTFLLTAPPAGAVDEPLQRLAFVCEAIREHLDTPPCFRERATS